MTDETTSNTLDYEKFRKLLESLSAEQREIFGKLLRDVDDRGKAPTEADLDDLAKKYADIAQRLTSRRSAGT